MLLERSPARDHTDMKRSEESDAQREKADEWLERGLGWEEGVSAIPG